MLFVDTVVAFNQIGEANVAAQEVTGFSGEDVPLEAPTNFTLNQIIDERSAILSWNPVNPDSVQGTINIELPLYLGKVSKSFAEEGRITRWSSVWALNL